MSLSSCFIGDDNGVVSFDLSDSAIDLAAADTASHTEESVSPIFDTEFRVPVPVLLSVGGEDITLSFPLFDDLPLEGSLDMEMPFSVGV